MKVAQKTLHIVQISYDESVFFQHSASDTLKRQLSYGNLLRQDNSGALMTFLVLTYNQELTSFRRDNVFFRPVLLHRSTSIITDLLNYLYQLDKNIPIDAIATQTIIDDGLAALHLKRKLAAKGRSLRVVGQIHFDMYSKDAIRENFGKGPGGMSKYRRIVGTLHDYDALRVVSSAVRDKILHDGLHSCVETIPVPVTLLAREIAIESPCRERMVLFVGRLEAAKRMDIWLQVAKLLSLRDPYVRFEIVGDGSLRESLQTMTDSLGISDRVRFHGAVPYEQLATHYSRAQVFLLTSSNEGFGRVLVEALAYRVPVVATRLRGIEDIVQDNRTGYLAQFGDIENMAGRIEQLLNDDSLRNAMAEEGMRHVNTLFHPAALARRWVTLMHRQPSPMAAASHGIQRPRSATYSRYKKLKSMQFSLLQALQYERLEGLELQGRTLDIGGGSQNSYYNLLRVNGAIESVNINPVIKPTHLADLNKPLPFAANTYDNIISLNTFEHIYEDRLAISEAIRILKPGGSFHFMVPFLYRVHGSPNDYHRHTAAWWHDFLIGTGIAETDLTVEPLVWDPASSAAALIDWQNNPTFRRWLMMGAISVQRRSKEKFAPSDYDDFALGYYLHGKKKNETAVRYENEFLSDVPHQRYFQDANYTSKYALVAKWLTESKINGDILDIGARDRILAKYINSRNLNYYSADTGNGHDYCINLELKLPFIDFQFQSVVCLDVLEHVENIHEAFKELARVASHSLIIALPNMAVYSKRISFLNKGHLGTGKYDLLPNHQGDRHRWLTTYSQCNRFIESMSRKCGYSVSLIVEEMEDWRVFNMSPAKEELKNGLFCDRCIYFLKRR